MLKIACKPLSAVRQNLTGLIAQWQKQILDGTYVIYEKFGIVYILCPNVDEAKVMDRILEYGYRAFDCSAANIIMQAYPNETEALQAIKQKKVHFAYIQQRSGTDALLLIFTQNCFVHQLKPTGLTKHANTFGIATYTFSGFGESLKNLLRPLGYNEFTSLPG